jgi:hypothetical protein
MYRFTHPESWLTLRALIARTSWEPAPTHFFKANVRALFKRCCCAALLIANSLDGNSPSGFDAEVMSRNHLEAIALEVGKNAHSVALESEIDTELVVASGKGAVKDPDRRPRVNVTLAAVYLLSIDGDIDGHEFEACTELILEIDD